MTMTDPRSGTHDRDTHEGFRPIADYGLLADCNSAALVDRGGSIAWLCLPRYDSPALFAQILDPEGGHWQIKPTGAYRSERRYLPGTLVIETTFTTEYGSVRLTDALAFAEGQRHHELGFGAPHLLLRLVEGVLGEVELGFELAPRPEYGLVRPLFRATESGGRTFGGPNQVVVTAGVTTAIENSTMSAIFTVSAGQQVGLALQWAPPEQPAPEPFAPDQVASRIDDTVAAWRS
jgi:GH15 family glucan-1,4-alpha-glucosidase